ncbi:MAG TPA: CHAT domain-containing protein [Methylomirabilota bacterium]|nr:CHAT domain-containing protein [Methylomirabilota bacterium]
MRSSTFARCLVLATAIGLITCREQDRVSAILRVAPALEPELARHLILDSDAEFQAFAAASYTLDLRAAVAAFAGLVPAAPTADYERAYRLVRPYWGRATTALEQCFGLRAYARDLAHIDSLTVEERWKTRSLGLYLDSLNSRSRAGLPIGPAAIAEQVAWCEAGGHWRQLMGLREWLAGNCHAHGGRYDEERRHKREALALARLTGDVLKSCQLAGELMHLDSTLSVAQEDALLDSLQAESQRHGIVDQVGRFYAFKASVAKRQGRLVLERRLRFQALEAWDGVPNSAGRVRPLVELTGFLVGLDCWDEVSALIRRSEAHAAGFRKPLRDMAMLDVTLYRAQALAHDGREREALPVLERLDPARIRTLRPVLAPPAYSELASVHEALGHDDEALAELERGIDFCLDYPLPSAIPPLLAQSARLLVRNGAPDSALRRLRWFDARFPRLELKPAVHVELLGIRSQAQSRLGDRSAARASLTHALETLWTWAYTSDAGAESYLALADPPGLRESLFEVSPHAPGPTYRSELALQAWVRVLGGRARGEPAARWDWHTTSLAPSLQPGEAHVLFAFVGGRLCRWSATPGGVSLDTLAGDPAEWRRRVSALRESLARPGGESSARASLRSLARELLPDRLRADQQLRRLYWSPAGPLAAIPLEALDVGSGERYEPLGSRLEAATLRGAASERAPAAGVSVVAAPELSEAEQRLHPGLVPLQQSAAEAEDVRRAWPRARVLNGAAATEAAVLESWTDAGLIHIAAHLVRLDEIPYYDFIPLAPDRTGARDATLEVADVRQCDLSRCELVVLSTCASGVPYVGRRRVGPSMADAFLDAGARAVLRSLRPVEDGEARRFVDAFLGEWRANGHDAVAAAHGARLRLSAAGPAWDSPAAWATWSVAVNVPFREVTSEPSAVALARRHPAPGDHD